MSITPAQARTKLKDWFADILDDCPDGAYSLYIRFIAGNSSGTTTGSSRLESQEYPDDETIGFINTVFSYPSANITESLYNKGPGSVERETIGGTLPTSSVSVCDTNFNTWFGDRLDDVPDTSFTNALLDAIDDISTYDPGPADAPPTPPLVQAFMNAFICLVPGDVVTTSYSVSLGVSLQTDAGNAP